MPSARRGRRGARDRPFTQRYLKYKHEGQYIDLPAVHIRIFSPTMSTRTFALVDTGATVSFLPLEIAEVLDLKYTDESEATGAGGNFDTWISKIIIQILKGMNSRCEIEVEVQIPKEYNKVPYAILGRDSIFKCYDVTFREAKKQAVFRSPKGV